jgi:valyl-tRNA synthetase
VWSWWREGSVHRAAWPTTDDLKTDGDPAVLETAGAVLAEVRKAKSNAKTSMKTPVTSLVITDTPERLALVRLAKTDIVNAGVVSGELTLVEGEPAIEVTLGEAPPKQ